MLNQEAITNPEKELHWCLRVEHVLTHSPMVYEIRLPTARGPLTAHLRTLVAKPMPDTDFGTRLLKTYPVWFLEPESLNEQHMDPLGVHLQIAVYRSPWRRPVLQQGRPQKPLVHIHMYRYMVIHT